MDTIDLYSTARAGSLAGLPPEIFTVDRLIERNAAGHTPLHIMARHGCLRELPPGLLNAALLSVRNDSGYTPLHLAALGGHLDYRCRRKC